MICLLRDYWENEMECFFVFVEGPDDERFITSVLGNDKIKVIKYAREKKEYINRYIKSIKRRNLICSTLQTIHLLLCP